MSNVLKSVVTGWIHSSPAPKKPTNGDKQQDNETPRGVKRKAPVDPYDEMDDQEDDVARKTPSTQPNKLSRISSGTPTSGRRGRPPSSKKARRSRTSGAKNEDPSEKEGTNTRNSLVPVADMGNADELLGDDQVDNADETKSSSKAGTSDKDATKGRQNATGAQQDQDQEPGEEQEIEAILSHRASEREKGAIELLIHWTDETVDEATWEPEDEIQASAAETVYDYWKAQGGRGRALFQDLQLPEVYHVFQLLRHEKKQRGGFHLEVQWVGYSDSPIDTTWEPEAKLRTVAPGPLDEYWDSVGGRDKFLAKRGRSKRS